MHNPHSQPLIDAFRAWHRWEHGDRVGALGEARQGIEVPEEWRDVFEAQADLVAAYENAEDAAEEHGHDSEEFQQAAELWTRAVTNLAEVMGQAQESEGEDEPPPARGGGRGQGQGQGQGAGGRGGGGGGGGGSGGRGGGGGGVDPLLKPPAMTRASMGIGPATQKAAQRSGRLGGVVNNGQSLGDGVTMGPIDSASIRDLPPSMYKGGS